MKEYTGEAEIITLLLNAGKIKPREKQKEYIPLWA